MRVSSVSTQEKLTRTSIAHICARLRSDTTQHNALNKAYRDKTILRSKYFWGDKAIADTRPLREQLMR